MTASSSDDARLPAILVPNHYDLVYNRIDLVNHVFEGTVSIFGSAAKTSSTILVHALDVQIVCATVKAKDDETLFTAHEFRYSVRNQTCEIIWDSKTVFQEGSSYELCLSFQGVLNDQMRGFYRSTYLGLDGKSHTMATTQFEPTDARRAFPCLDEPAIKATFQVTVNIPVFLTCISNTPVASSHTRFAGSKPVKTVTFQKTPKMSTYLVGFVIGLFDCISQTSRGVVTTIYTVPGKAGQAKFALDVASRALDLFQDMFKIPYPLVKSDLLAIPDFAAGAMENWGVVTYREAKILVKPGATSESTLRGIARTVCHELAHMWFGNLCTPEWWTQLWLKEGVARYMEFVAIDALFPEWDASTEFVQSVYGLALSLDSMNSSHPVEVEVKHPDEINEIFDAISYAKGASIVRMLSSHIGQDTFMEGMRVYLSRHAYGNAVTNDVWGALEEASGFPVVAFMKPWTLDVGYPILILSNDGSTKATRFFASGPVEGESSTRWPIPVTAIVEGLKGVQGPWVVNGLGADHSGEQLCAKLAEWSAAGKWFKLNVDETAFFRTSYSREQWDRLSKVMHPDGPLSVKDRLGLISDSFGASQAGYVSIVDSLRFVERFGEHKAADYAVWQELSENLGGLASLFRSESFFGKFQVFLKDLYASHMARIGWEAVAGESARTGTLRATIIGILGAAGDEDVLKGAYDRFMAFKEDPVRSHIAGDSQRVIFKCALKFDENIVFSGLKEIYEQSTFPEEQRNCLAVMGCVKDAKQHASFWDYIVLSGQVRYQDIAFPLNSLSGSSDEGGRATWQYFQENHDILHARLGAGPVWGTCVGLSCRGLATLQEADEVEQFFANTKTLGSAKRRMAQALEIVRTRATRRERDKNAVEEYLTTRIR